MLLEMFETLITVEQARRGLGLADWRFVDCRFDLRDVDAGRAAYERGHIPGAVYAHLDDDLSGQVVTGETGRHPLPDDTAMASLVQRLGVDAHTQVVVYDDLGGRIAARLWWMLRYAGLEKVAVLDGGWPAWAAGTRERERTVRSVAPSHYAPSFRRRQVVSTAMVEAWVREGGAPTLLDARAAARYRGEVEPLDPIAGHIPGALSSPCANSLDEEGMFRARPILREAFLSAMSEEGPGRGASVAYCGSGVTACHLILAMTHAGLAPPRLYPGSWSAWCGDATRPISTGPTAGNETSRTT